MKSSVKSLFTLIGISLIALISCNKESVVEVESLGEKHTCEMKLVGSLANYSDQTTKAVTDQDDPTIWEDKSIIYLRLNSPLGSTTGEAIYDAKKDIWTVSYYGSLYEGPSANACKALYIEDHISYSEPIFEMNHSTVIYEDIEGSYIYEDGDLVVTANLKPKTGRLRFKGTPGQVLKVYGITHYLSYDVNTDNYMTSMGPFDLTVDSEGYTPYFYGYFTDTDEPNIKVWIDAKEAYTRFCSDNIFQPGQSGRMTVPTEDAQNGWTDGLYFSLAGTKFKMVPVEGGTFTMGLPESTNTYLTAHNVTLTGFCIAETEMTNQLYGKKLQLQNNSNASSYTNLLPYRDVGKSNAIKYIAEISELIGVELTLPTEAQWEYAARGGNKSKGYIYSGSNNLNDVGWYNTSIKAVKGKKPNELGIYDMSGNAYEHVLDDYAEYPTNSQIDPCHDDTNDKIVVRGGSSASSTEANCANYSRYQTSYSNNVGIRFALNWN